MAGEGKTYVLEAAVCRVTKELMPHICWTNQLHIHVINCGFEAGSCLTRAAPSPILRQRGQLRSMSTLSILRLLLISRTLGDVLYILSSRGLLLSRFELWTLEISFQVMMTSVRITHNFYLFLKDWERLLSIAYPTTRSSCCSNCIPNS